MFMCLHTLLNGRIHELEENIPSEINHANIAIACDAWRINLVRLCTHVRTRI